MGLSVAKSDALFADGDGDERILAGQPLEYARTQHSVILGGGKEKSEIHGPRTLEGRKLGLRSLQYVNDESLGQGVVFVDKVGRTRFIPASNIKEVMLEE